MALARQGFHQILNQAEYWNGIVNFYLTIGFSL